MSNPDNNKPGLAIKTPITSTAAADKRNSNSKTFTKSQPISPKSPKSVESAQEIQEIRFTINESNNNQTNNNDNTPLINITPDPNDSQINTNTNIRNDNNNNNTNPNPPISSATIMQFNQIPMTNFERMNSNQSNISSASNTSNSILPNNASNINRAYSQPTNNEEVKLTNNNNQPTHRVVSSSEFASNVNLLSNSNNHLRVITETSPPSSDSTPSARNKNNNIITSTHNNNNNNVTHTSTFGTRSSGGNNNNNNNPGLSKVYRTATMWSSTHDLNGYNTMNEENDINTIRCCNKRCSINCHKIYNDIVAYFQSYESHYVFLCLIAIIIGAVCYYEFPSVYEPYWNNNLYKWPFTFLFFIALYEVAYVTEKFVLYLLSLTIASFLWRFYFYLSCIQDTFQKIAFVSVAIQFRKMEWFTIDDRLASYLDPILFMSLVILVLHVLRKMISKHWIWMQNQKNFSEKIEELFFIVDFLAILNNADNYDPDLPNKVQPIIIDNKNNGRRGSITISRLGPTTPRSTKSSDGGIPLPGGKRNPNTYGHPTLNVPGGAAFNEILLKVRNWTIAQTEAREILRSVKTARDAARDIFNNIDHDGKGYLTVHDFKCYLPIDRACRAFYACLPPDQRAEILSIEERSREKTDGTVMPEATNADQAKAQKAAVAEIIRTIREENLVDRRVARHEFYSSMQSFAEERKKLSLRLTDWHSMSDVLVTVSNTIFIFVCFFVLLFVFGYNITTFLLPMTTLLVSFSFMFGNSVKTLLEAFLFIFVLKPYSIGDIIELRLHTEVFEVISIQLLSTTFKTHENKVVIIPNAVLGTMEITNLSRSKNPAYLIPIAFNIDTPSQSLIQLKSMLQSYINERSNIWQNKISLTLIPEHEISNTSLKAHIKVTHQTDFINQQMARAHLLDLMAYLTDCMKKLNMRIAK